MKTIKELLKCKVNKWFVVFVILLVLVNAYLLCIDFKYLYCYIFLFSFDYYLIRYAIALSEK